MPEFTPAVVARANKMVDKLIEEAKPKRKKKGPRTSFYIAVSDSDKIVLTDTTLNRLQKMIPTIKRFVVAETVNLRIFRCHPKGTIDLRV